MTQKDGICGLCFHSPGCAVKAFYDETGKLARIETDPDAPMGGILCPIAGSARDIIYADTRLKTPLKRVGPKGSYDFEPITWDEAFDLIVTRLTKLKEDHGPETVGLYCGTGSYERSFKDTFQLKNSEIYLASSVLFPFGSPNTFGVGAPCYTSLGVLAPKLTMGCLHIDMFSDVDKAELILVWGTDPSTSTPPALFERLKMAAEDGADIIVIDPRKTKAAELDGSQWLPIRPGSDGALALGLCHVLIRDDCYDDDFVEDWTLGFPEFKDYVQEFTPENVSALTGIASDRIEELAHSIADADGATYVMYTGLEYTKSGVQNIRAVMVLWALAGQLDVEGGRCFLPRENWLPLSKEHQIETPGFETSIGQGKFPVYAHYCGGEPHASLLPKAILDKDPYAIRGLLVYGASLITSWPDPNLWRRALRELDFLVTMDIQMTADAFYADLVLPATTGFEQESYCYYGRSLRFREKMVEPVGESRSGVDMFAELAKRLGYGHLFGQSPQERLNTVLKDSGCSSDDMALSGKKMLSVPAAPMTYRKWETGLLRSDGKPGFDTPSGKFEITSLVLEKYGYPGLPVYEESVETVLSNPKLAKRFPLVLGTGPFKPDMKSCLRAIPAFMEKYPSPVVEISETDAKEKGIAMGDWVTIKTVRGSVQMKAFVSDKIMTGFVYAPVGGGGPLGSEDWQQANVNELADMDQFDAISGFPVYKTLLCDVKKMKRKRRRVTPQDPTLGCVG